MAKAYGVPLESLAAYEKGRYLIYRAKHELDDGPEAVARFRKLDRHIANSYPLLFPPELTDKDRAWLTAVMDEGESDPEDLPDPSARTVVCLTPRSHAYQYVEDEIRELKCDAHVDYGEGVWHLIPVALGGNGVRGKTLLEAVDRLQAQVDGEPYDPSAEDSEEFPPEAVKAYAYVQELEEKLAAATTMPLFSRREEARKAAEKAHRDYQEYAAARMAAREPVQTYWSFITNAVLASVFPEAP